MAADMPAHRDRRKRGPDGASVLFFLLACGTPTTGDTADLQAERDALAADLWTELDGYESWGQAEPWTGLQLSSDGTHGEYVQIWLDELALASITADTATVGSIIAKRGYADEAGADPYGNLTVMWKLDDPAVAETGWLWVSFNATTGEVSKAEDNAGCAGCHASGSDWRRMVTDVPGGG